jgi:ligand-binding SRPBCC domain-containing protein
MPTLEFETTIAAPLEKVWAFYQDVNASLPALTAAEEGLTIESADVPVRVGSKIVLHVNGPFGRVRWVGRIVENQPPHAVVFGEEARFVDEQESGPFKFWRHEHEFERVDEKSTRVVDRLTYRVPFGPIGWLADAVFVRPKLKRLFRYRHDHLRRLLEDSPRRSSPLPS